MLRCALIGGSLKREEKRTENMSIFDIFNALEKNKKEKEGLNPPEFIIAGLGNPGTRYEDTRHNCGFMAAETLAEGYGAELKRLKFKSLTGELN